MLDIPPQLETAIIQQAELHGISPVAYLERLVLFDDTPLYDIERMNKCLAGVEIEELALKNGIKVPHFETVEELRYWRKNVLPKIKTALAEQQSEPLA